MLVILCYNTELLRILLGRTELTASGTISLSSSIVEQRLIPKISHSVVGKLYELSSLFLYRLFGKQSIWQQRYITVKVPSIQQSENEPESHSSIDQGDLESGNRRDYPPLLIAFSGNVQKSSTLTASPSALATLVRSSTTRGLCMIVR